MMVQQNGYRFSFTLECSGRSNSLKRVPIKGILKLYFISFGYVKPYEEFSATLTYTAFVFFQKQSFARFL